jgi:hypothetical protein
VGPHPSRSWTTARPKFFLVTIHDFWSLPPILPLTTSRPKIFFEIRRQTFVTKRSACFVTRCSAWQADFCHQMAHGLSPMAAHRLGEEARARIADVERLHSEWTDGAIAREAGVSAPSVGKYRLGRLTDRREASGRRARGTRPGPKEVGL